MDRRSFLLFSAGASLTSRVQFASARSTEDLRPGEFIVSYNVYTENGPSERAIVRAYLVANESETSRAIDHLYRGIVDTEDYNLRSTAENVPTENGVYERNIVILREDDGLYESDFFHGIENIVYWVSAYDYDQARSFEVGEEIFQYTLSFHTPDSEIIPSGLVLLLPTADELGFGKAEFNGPIWMNYRAIDEIAENTPNIDFETLWRYFRDPDVDAETGFTTTVALYRPADMDDNMVLLTYLVDQENLRLTGMVSSYTEHRQPEAGQYGVQFSFPSNDDLNVVSWIYTKAPLVLWIQVQDNQVRKAENIANDLLKLVFLERDWPVNFTTDDMRALLPTEEETGMTLYREDFNEVGQYESR